MTAERAPEAPGGWSGWSSEAGRTGTASSPVRPCTHHSLRSGPVRPLQGPPWYRTSLPEQRARFHDIFYKVSQNVKVSPKYVEKASVSP